MNESPINTFDQTISTSCSSTSSSIFFPFSNSSSGIEAEPEILFLCKNYDKSNKKLKLSTEVTNCFGNCRICDDKASGIHYCIATCEGII